MPASRRHWTAAQVRGLLDNSRHWPRYELIDGELLVTPAPAYAHQAAVTELIVVLRNYVHEQGIGDALVSPADLQLKPDSILQPDVFVFPTLRYSGDVPAWSDIKSLLLAVEVISPSSVRTDRVEKREFYMSSNVEEYWVVDLDGRHVERWRRKQETPEVVVDSLVWKPDGAKTSLVIELSSFFSSIGLSRRI